ncbi:MAG: antiviral reverse transcriptase Drt3b [Sphaerochaetaceae bacterium]
MKRKNISKNITRYLLSDVLPYEVPITFSNYSMVDFFNRIGLVVQRGDRKNALALRLSWDDKFVHDNENTLLFYLFDGGDEKSMQQATMTANSLRITNKNSIPFDFYTTRNNGQLRKLSVISPQSQLFMMWYYQQYSDVILYFCHRSDFSIRYPQKIAEWKYYKDYSHYLSVLACDQKATIEEFDNEYESLKSFFSYREFSNIYKFYESNLYHRIEQKFRYLKKVDISKCFDSLYTHSVAWFVYGKSYIKDNLCVEKESFVGILDKLMQNMNYAETHGIVIGPEFSRIFAEIILQAIDSDVESELREQKLFNKNQYQICRYVDDYFVFYNDESTIQEVIRVLQEKLLENKLYLNQAKETDISRPIITNVSIAKCKIEKLFEDLFPKKLSEGSKEDGIIVYSLDIPRISSCTLILQYKSTLAETGAGYQDVLNLVQDRILWDT